MVAMDKIKVREYDGQNKTKLPHGHTWTLSCSSFRVAPSMTSDGWRLLCDITGSDPEISGNGNLLTMLLFPHYIQNTSSLHMFIA